MQGTIVSYRRGVKTQHTNQFILKVDDKKYNSKESANALLGKTVIYKTTKKEIKGKITAPHGNKGTVRVIFERGMPGDILTQKVDIK